MVASQSQRSCSIVDSSAAECGLCPPEDRHGSLVAVAEQRGQSVEQKVGPCWTRGGGGAELAAWATSSVPSAWSSESPREHPRRQCIQIGLAGKGRIERRKPSRRLDQQWWRIASARGDERCLARAATRHVHAPGRSRAPVSAMARRLRASSSAPAWSFVCAAARARRRASLDGSRVSVTARSRKAVAAASPPRACARPAERSSSPASSSSGTDVACARGATRGDPGRAADRLRPPARGEPRAARSARPSRTPPTAQAGDGRSLHRRASATPPTPRRARPFPRPQADELHATAAPGRRAALPLLGAATAARRAGAAPAAA